MTDWKHCKPLLEEALSYTGGTHTIDDVQGALLQNRMALLAGENSALVCEIVDYPRLRALHVFLAAGNLTEIKSMNDRLDTTARFLGCSRITLAGRAGFARALKEFGYEKKWTCLSKDIANV